MSWSMDSQRSHHHKVVKGSKDKDMKHSWAGKCRNSMVLFVEGKMGLGEGRGYIGGQGSYSLAELLPLLFSGLVQQLKQKART